MTTIAVPQAGASPVRAAGLDVEAVRRDFPILRREVQDGKPLVYLDSAATSQKPQAVLDALEGYYARHNATVHRGAHTLAEEATDALRGGAGQSRRLHRRARARRWCSPRTRPRP